MSARLAITFIDVGWGDSILIESTDETGQVHLGLIDSNDTIHQWSSLLFLKRYCERKGIAFDRPAQAFRFVLLTHSHADHASGLSRIIRRFGAEHFLYSASSSPADPMLARLLRYPSRSGARLTHTLPVARGTSLAHIPFGRAQLNVLWPRRGFSSSDENDSSIVLAITLGQVSFVLTGDTTATVWPNIVSHLPPNTGVFQVPHHGAFNGTLDAAANAPWFTHLAKFSPPPQFAISCHPRPHRHPHPSVIKKLTGSTIRRTDQDYHLRFETDGATVRTLYTH